MRLEKMETDMVKETLNGRGVLSRFSELRRNKNIWKDSFEIYQHLLNESSGSRQLRMNLAFAQILFCKVMDAALFRDGDESLFLLRFLEKL